MSVESMAIVLHHSRARGTAKLVLLGIANHEGDGGAWPSLATLAKYANVDERNVRAALRKLEASGELVTQLQGGGTVDTIDELRPNRYRVNLTCPGDCDRTTNHRTARQLRLVGQPVDNSGTDRGMPASPGDASVPPGGMPSTGGGGMPASPEPSTQPSKNQGGPVGLSATDRARAETPGQRAAREGAERRAAARAQAASPDVVAARAAEARAAVAAARDRRRAAP